MSKVKICGLTRNVDIEYVNKYLPDYIGFVFAASRRQVNADDALKLSNSLDKWIKKAGVFVNHSIDEVLNIASVCGLDIIQLSGDEDFEYVKKLKSKVRSKVEIWKAIRIKDETSLSNAELFDADGILLDAYAGNSYGGSGKSFDWTIAAKASKKFKIILAGGLDCTKVKQAIEIVNPFAVDVSSGVETDGYKDETKIKEFIVKARFKQVQ